MWHCFEISPNSRKNAKESRRIYHGEISSIHPNRKDVITAPQLPCQKIYNVYISITEQMMYARSNILGQMSRRCINGTCMPQPAATPCEEFVILTQLCREAETQVWEMTSPAGITYICIYLYVLWCLTATGLASSERWCYFRLNSTRLAYFSDSQNKLH